MVEWLYRTTSLPNTTACPGSNSSSLSMVVRATQPEVAATSNTLSQLEIFILRVGGVNGESGRRGCGSVRPRLLVPRTVERFHSAADREELALRVHLASDAMVQLVEERAFEILREQHTGVTQRQGWTLHQLARQ